LATKPRHLFVREKVFAAAAQMAIKSSHSHMGYRDLAGFEQTIADSVGNPPWRKLRLAFFA